MNNQDARISAGWEALRGTALVNAPVEEPIFEGHPRFAREFSYQIAIFVLRVFHNREHAFYQDANQALIRNCRFYIENTDVRDDRDSFYWNISELCRAMLRYDSLGSDEAGLISPEAEQAFLDMAFGYCHDMSHLSDADSQPLATWRIYESENHHVQRDSALWQLMLILIRHGYGQRTLGDGETLQTHFDAWSRFFSSWIRERASKSMFVEVHSKCYGIHTIKNIYPLYDFAEDPQLKQSAGHFITLFWALWAEEQIAGIQGGGQSRIYPDEALTTQSEAQRWAWYYAGLGAPCPPAGMDYILLDSSYRLPELIVDLILSPEKRGTYITESRPLGLAAPDDLYPDYRPNTDWGQIYRYTYCTPHFILGTQMYPQLTAKDWCLISSQNRFQGIVFPYPDAMVLPLPESNELHNLHSVRPTIAFHSFWSQMCEGTLITQRCQNYSGAMRVWFSAAGGLDQWTEKNGWLFTSCAEAYLAVKICRGDYTIENDPEHPGKWLRCTDGSSPVILEASDSSSFSSFSAFQEAVTTHSPIWDGSTMRYHSLYGHDFCFITDTDGPSTIDGEYYVKKIPYSFHSPFIHCLWNDHTVKITFAGKEICLNF